MLPWECLATAPAAERGKELSLWRRGSEYVIRVGHLELMNSRRHASEEALATRACAALATVAAPRVLIGGLGMGFTVAAALRTLGPKAEVVVAELVPTVIDWNRGPLAELAGRPLDDPRVTVQCCDVAVLLRRARRDYDAVLLDVDNGPVAISHDGNRQLYDETGLYLTAAALRKHGVLAVWSSGADDCFAERLKGCGYKVEELGVAARGKAGGRRHTIWLARPHG